MASMTDSHSAFPPQLQLRKLPKQNRSRFLVDAIKEACLIELKRNGTARLTSHRIAEIAGVAVGSVYQYFASADAIIAAILQEKIEKNVERAERALSGRWRHLDLYACLRELLEGLVHYYIQLHSFGTEFCRRYRADLEYHRWFRLEHQYGDDLTYILYRLIGSHLPDMPLVVAEQRSRLLAGAVRGALDGLLSRNEYSAPPLSQPGLVEPLLEMCKGLLCCPWSAAENTAR
jgi:AcrR family transcriptional regulator